MKQELWLARDKDGDYSFSDMEPEKNEYGYFHPFLEVMGENAFHKLFPGHSLRKGRKKRIKRILIELED